MTEEEVYSILKNNSNVLDYGEHEWDNSWRRNARYNMKEYL